MMLLKSLSVYNPVKNSSNNWLHRPNGRDDSHVDIAHVSIVDCQEDGAHDHEIEAACEDECYEVAQIELIVDNQIVWMPNVVDGLITVVPYGHDHLEGDAGNKGTETQIKDARQPINLRRNNARHLITACKENHRAERVRKPCFTFRLGVAIVLLDN